MCLTCGCGGDAEHSHGHEHSHDHGGGGEATRLLTVEQDLLAGNMRHATAVRQRLQRQQILGLNLVSSPGSGKTTLLTQTVQRLHDAAQKVWVIEGDQQTTLDADRIKAAGANAIQINTGKGCHLDAHGVGHALDELGLEDNGVLFIENVGNLVCPALFDLGEAHKVVILSVTEGEDKPIKYPHMFAASDLMIINKTDLLPYVPFNMDACVAYAKRVNPRIDIIQLSAHTGEGLDEWMNWIQRERDALAALMGV